MKNLFSLAWRFAEVGAYKFGGKKSEYFREALRMVRDMFKEGKDEKEVREEIYGDTLFVPNDLLPIIPYGEFKRGGDFEKYRSFKGKYSFWLTNRGKGRATADAVDLGAFSQFKPAEDGYEVRDFLEDEATLDYIAENIFSEVLYIPEYRRYVYKKVYEDLQDVDHLPEKKYEPDYDELAAMSQYDAELKEIFGDDFE